MPQASEQTREDFLHLTLAALQSNEVVVGVWLVGSLAAGTRDPYSDIDLRVVVRAESQESFLDELPAFSRSFCDAVLVQRRGSLVNVVTRDWLRLDDSRSAQYPRPLSPVVGLGLGGRQLEPAQVVSCSRFREDEITQSDIKAEESPADTETS